MEIRDIAINNEFFKVNKPEYLFDFLVGYAPKPDEENKEILEQFYSKVDSAYRYQYTDNPEWNSTFKNKKFIIMWFEDEDFVFVPLVYKGDYFIIPVDPISYNGNVENMITAIKLLKDLKVEYMITTGENSEIEPYMVSKSGNKYYKLSLKEVIGEMTGGEHDEAEHHHH